MWVQLLACPAVIDQTTLLGKPAVAPARSPSPAICRPKKPGLLTALSSPTVLCAVLQAAASGDSGEDAEDAVEFAALNQMGASRFFILSVCALSHWSVGNFPLANRFLNSSLSGCRGNSFLNCS
jgi:hypothetical protein